MRLAASVRRAVGDRMTRKGGVWMLGRRGQHIGEYAVLVGVVASAFVGTQMYVSRRLAGSLIGASTTILGTERPAEDGTSRSSSSGTVSEQGNAGGIVTQSASTAEGESHAGFILAEAYGPYVRETLTFTKPTSFEPIISALAEEDETVFSVLEEDDGTMTVVLQGRDGKKRTLSYKVVQVVAVKEGEATALWAFLDTTGDGVSDTVVVGLPTALTEEALALSLIQDDSLQQMASGVAKFFKDLETELGREEPTDQSLTRLSDKQRDRLTETAQSGREAAERIEQNLEGVRPGELPREKLLELAEEIRQDLETVDQADRSIRQTLTPSPTTRRFGERAITLDDDDQNGLYDTYGYLDSGNLWRSVLNFDGGLEADEEVAFVLQPISELPTEDAHIEDDEGWLNKERDAIEADAWRVVEEEVGDEAVVSILEGIVTDVKDTGTGYFRLGATTEDLDGFIQTFMENERYEEWGIRSDDTARVGRLQDVLDQLVVSDGPADDRDRLGQAIDTLLVSDTAAEKREVYRGLGGGEFLVVNSDVYHDDIVTSQEYELPEWRQQAGHSLERDDLGFPVGINTDEDEELEIRFLSGSGRRELHAVQENVNGHWLPPRAMEIEETATALPLRAPKRNEDGGATSDVVEREPVRRSALVLGVSLD